MEWPRMDEKRYELQEGSLSRLYALEEVSWRAWYTTAQIPSLVETSIYEVLGIETVSGRGWNCDLTEISFNPRSIKAFSPSRTFLNASKVAGVRALPSVSDPCMLADLPEATAVVAISVCLGPWRFSHGSFY